MSGSVYGRLFTITSWGESHGQGIGVVVDGVPAGLALNEDMIQNYLDRRKPGTSRFTTKRQEGDKAHILSGVFEGRATGTPVSIAVWNEDQRSRDYSEIAGCYRPGHADYTFDAKYGFRDYRGGGRSSGRETIARVAAGAIAAEILKELHITVRAYTRSIGPVAVDYSKFDWDEISRNPFSMPDSLAAERTDAYLREKMNEMDSAGGVIECIVTGMPPGIGEPVFDKLDSCLARAVMSIGAVKGVEIGDGFQVSQRTGSENNDSFYFDKDEKLQKRTNHAGGILGGMSDGSPLILRAAIKPTPSIARTQETVNKQGENITVNIKGRHDPVIVPRAVVVVESMVAVTLVDQLFLNMHSRLDRLKDFYVS
ncbi:chorismate synthase [Anaerolentibacter hominis]|uniref:chorismate synthase n=1 Tax=Anaerolentibacter hominis TaxID=3079009 RepID=UPI0031B816CF